MAEREPSNPNATDPAEGFEYDRDETRQGFEREQQDVVPESATNADELYSGETTGEIVDPGLLHDRDRDRANQSTSASDNK